METLLPCRACGNEAVAGSVEIGGSADAQGNHGRHRCEREMNGRDRGRGDRDGEEHAEDKLSKAYLENAHIAHPPALIEGIDRI